VRQSLSKPGTTTTSRSEHEEQREFVAWFRRTYPGVRIIAIPNGGKRGAAEAGRLKMEGVTAGVSDLFIPGWLTWVEMKRVGGKESPEQAAWGREMIALGYRYFLVFGCEHAKGVVLESV